MIGHDPIVGDDYYGGAFAVQLVQNIHDVSAVFGIQITGRLVGQYDFRIIDQ